MHQKPEESIADYISHVREKATPCKFTPEELNDCLTEMVILLTPTEDFQKDLLTTDNTYIIAQTIEVGHEYEAVIASQTSLKSSHLHSQKPRCSQNLLLNWLLDM